MNISKRDIQKQLECILQPRPNQIRLGAHVAQARLGVLRDCRALRRSRRKAKHLHGQPIVQSRTDIKECCVQEGTQKSVLVPGSGLGGDWSLLDMGPDPGHQAFSPSLGHLASQESRTIQEIFIEVLSAGTLSLPVLQPGNSGSDIALFQLEEVESLLPSDTERGNFGIQDQRSVEHWPGSFLSNASSTSPAGHNHGSQKSELLPDTLDQRFVNYDWALEISEVQCVHPEVFRFPSITLPNHLRIDKSSLEVSKAIVGSVQPNQANPGSDRSATKSTSASASGISQAIHNTFLGDRPDGESRLPVGGRPSRASLLSITSLNKRLSSKYPHSYLEDIMSLVDRFTISGSSTSFSSSARTSEISSKKSSRSFQRQSEIIKSLSVDDQPILPIRVKAPVPLPGVFDRYCVAQMEENLLEPCRSDGLLCEHTRPDSRRFFVSYLDAGKVLYRRIASRDINDVDSFDNTILHIAASLGLRIQYIIKLIDEKADINATNTAGETFLHLLYAPTCADDVCSLLQILSIGGFNFGQHDQHGQTSLHLLTRPWLPRQYLIEVIKEIHCLGFVLPTSRDNLGFTLLRQAKHLGTQALGYDPEQDMAFRLSLRLTCETQGYVVYPQNTEPSAASAINGNEYLHYYENQALIYTMDDLQQYEHHANLLRTIVRAGNEPWFEDSKGRNGLHCLAEVAFDLPLPKSPAGQAEFPKEEELGNFKTLRERYLDGLVTAGVNPNNYDKEGNTPLMAFITHTRTNEDDETTTRILTNLIDAKADIHRRNQQGETALHLAVKLGRRAATNLLLRKGANVHARNKRGSGILEAATEASGKAGRDEKSYAQILLCTFLAMRAGAVSSPTIMQEWDSRSRRT
jgi:ankyrin repeat protein